MEKIKRKKELLNQRLKHWNEYPLLPESIRPTCNVYQQVIHASAVEITRRIREREWTAELVTRIFCHRSLQVHSSINCLTEILFDRALERAQSLDLEQTSTGQVSGLLHGLPVSVKDHFWVKGYDATSGYSKYLFQPCQDDANLVQQLERQGAIVFAKTNVPQTLMTFDCSNPIYGRTLNPNSHGYSPGGSSGGEAALIAANGSCLGMGGDIGGSLRIPAHFCGIYSLKPTSGRFSLKGNNSGYDGQTHILPALGPMARNIDDLELFIKAVAQDMQDHEWEQQRDRSILYNRPFTQVQLSGKLRIGYYDNDGFLKPSPACSRAVHICVEALERQGHELVKFHVPSPEEACHLFFMWAGADGLNTYKTSLGRDSKERSYINTMRLYGLPRFIKVLVSYLLGLFGQQRAAKMIRSMGEVSVEQLYVLHHRQLQYIDQFQKYWDELNVDFVIAPGFGSPACPHDSFDDLSINACYTSLYNLLNFSVGVIPVTRVDPELDDIRGKGSKENRGGDLIDMVRSKYENVVETKGLPVGVQIVGGYRQDEKTLAAMRVVDTALKLK